MKKNHILFSCLLAFSSFICCSSFQNGHGMEQCKPKLLATLDSLQGSWINEEDTALSLIINGRLWCYNYQEDSMVKQTCYRMYFSDTAVAAIKPSLAFFDSTATSGTYLILKSIDNLTLDCSELMGFSKLQGDLFFAIRPHEYWTMASIRTFKRIN